MSPNPEDTQPFKGKLAEPEPTDNGLQLPPARRRLQKVLPLRIPPAGTGAFRYPLGPDPVVIGRIGPAPMTPTCPVPLIYMRGSSNSRTAASA